MHRVHDIMTLNCSSRSTKTDIFITMYIMHSSNRVCIAYYTIRIRQIYTNLYIVLGDVKAVVVEAVAAGGRTSVILI